jgi:hypothetical protein
VRSLVAVLLIPPAYPAETDASERCRAWWMRLSSVVLVMMVATVTKPTIGQPLPWIIHYSGIQDLSI